MAYVRRDSSGKIVAYSQSEQSESSGYMFCRNDDPELVELNRQINAGYVPPSPAELEKIRAEHAIIAKEHDELKQRTEMFNQLFGELELALGNLLAEIIQKHASRVAHAIYYSPTSFHARSEMVGNALIQLASENNEKLADLESLWETIDQHIGKARKLRNAAAHGSQITQQIRGKKYVRLSPPAYDVIRIDRVLAKRQIPGLSVSDMQAGCNRVSWLSDRVEQVRRTVAAFHSDIASLPDRLRELGDGLKIAPREIVNVQRISNP